MLRGAADPGAASLLPLGHILTRLSGRWPSRGATPAGTQCLETTEVTPPGSVYFR